MLHKCRKSFPVRTHTTNKLKKLITFFTLIFSFVQAMEDVKVTKTDVTQENAQFAFILEAQADRIALREEMIGLFATYRQMMIDYAISQNRPAPTRLSRLPEMFRSPLVSVKELEEHVLSGMTQEEITIKFLNIRRQVIEEDGAVIGKRKHILGLEGTLNVKVKLPPRTAVKIFLNGKE